MNIVMKKNQQYIYSKVGGGGGGGVDGYKSNILVVFNSDCGDHIDTH